MTFGEKLQKLRKARHLSQEELAAQLSVTRQTISKWELDQSTPELGLLAQISDIFGVTTDYLIKETAASDGERVSEMQPSKKPSARLALYIILLCLGVAGMLIFWFFSKIGSWEFQAGDGRIFYGFLGYLLTMRSTLIFVLCVLAAIVGLFGLIYLAAQEKKKST